MTKENAHLYLPFVQALAEGKEIELMTFGGQWIPLKEISFEFPHERYRIKPEKKLVQFTWEDRGLLISKYVMSKDDKYLTTIIGVLLLEDGSVRIDLSGAPIYPDDLLENFTFLDGSPCGKEVEE